MQDRAKAQLEPRPALERLVKKRGDGARPAEDARQSKQDADNNRRRADLLRKVCQRNAHLRLGIHGAVWPRIKSAIPS